jgi:hypothetical protein
MTYHVVPLPAPRQAAPSPSYLRGVALQPLPSAPLGEAPARRGLSPQMKALVVAIVVVLIVVALLWWIERMSGERELQRNSRSPRKQSTAQMAKNLYQRLQDRGGVDHTTMRSLAQLSRNA